MFFHSCFTFMYAPRHQVKFLVCVNLPGNKPVSDSEEKDGRKWLKSATPLFSFPPLKKCIRHMIQTKVNKQRSRSFKHWQWFPALTLKRLISFPQPSKQPCTCGLDRSHIDKSFFVNMIVYVLCLCVSLRGTLSSGRVHMPRGLKFREVVSYAV